ncbi:ABC transporter ATP-binding protein [Cytobacillus solani]|uniref:Peptide ABC transporter ATP-binding protein n=1 Tax=Cytobacillus solani TaxID=1637975 RepID=A0A0Q3QUH1_9BACI|nr:ABC transporter ATP-binding protein [Cytobacillus solani]KOP71927.1 peptide ABC transporter ATP-binding protein [Bacillus sp. FJAT-21945]KQL21414.1 peptide ABC transporter ATP-binding protein [Cytobacillus solani]USK54712.1 ABC transporter ATP-binding protein [Cytobacillus solani]
METKLLEVKNLKTHFNTERGRVTAVDGVFFTVYAGETVGVVGESGCGKSVTAESILRLLDEKSTEYEGEILYKGKNLLTSTINDMQSVRGNDISMIFQDPMSSLNPVYTVGNQIVESIMLHQNVNKKEAYEKATEMLRLTGIPSPEKRIHEYPHELSGGMRQRVMIAMALSCQPKLLIADEPTTALDVTTQSQILDLINELKVKFNMGTVMITHDLGVVAEVCTKVVVMYLGQVIEEADVRSLFSSPYHPYTDGLLKSIPQLTGDRSKKLHVIEGKVPTLHQIPKGCRFAPRCAFASEKCHEEMPELAQADHSRKVRCWHYKEIFQAGEEGPYVSAADSY